MDGNLKKELKQYEKRKSKAQDKGDLEEEARLCSIIGDLLKEHGFYEESIKEHKQALQINVAKSNIVECAVAHRMIGECLCSLGRHEESLEHQDLYLQLAKSSNNLVEEQRALATIGSTWFSYFDYAIETELREKCLIKAQRGFLDGLSACDKLKGLVPDKEILEMRSRLYLNLGLVFDTMNDVASAKKFIKEALRIIRGENLLETECKCYYNLGGLLGREGEDNEAIEVYNNALDIARKSGQKFEEAEILVGIGQVYLKMEEFLSARRVLKKAFKIAESRADEMSGLKPSLIAAIKGLKLINKLEQLSDGKESEQANVFDQLGDLCSDLKLYNNALVYYNKELDLARSIGQSAKNLSRILVSMALTYSDLGQLKKAVEYYKEELNTIEGDYKGMCDTWCNIAEVYERDGQSYEDVQQAYSSALKFAEKAASLKLQIRVKEALADCQKKYEKLNLYEETRSEIDMMKSELKDEEEESDDEVDIHEDCVQFEDDDVLIDIEMNMPESDDEERDNGNDGSAVRKKALKPLKVNEKGETLLHVAAINGNVNQAKWLLDKGADVNARDFCGWQPLHEACNHGHTEIVRLLLLKGANVNDQEGKHCQGVTPLHDAAQNGHLDIVKLLVEHGASLLNKDDGGKTPLDSVISVQRTEDRDLDDSKLTSAAVGRKEVVKYLKKFALGKSLSNNITCPEITRRNRLFDEDDEDVVVPSATQLNERLRKKDRQRAKHRQRVEIDSDGDSDDVTDTFVPSFSRETSSPGDSMESFNSFDDKLVVKHAAIREDCEQGDDFEEDSPVGCDSSNSISRCSILSTSNESLHMSSREKIQNNTIHQSDFHSSDSTTSYIDTVYGGDGGSKEREPVSSLISERDLECAMGAQVTDESDWLIDDMRPLKRRRTTPKQLQATLGTSLQLSSKRPIAYQRRPSSSLRTHRTSPASRTCSSTNKAPRQKRMEVVRTPSPTFGPVSETFCDTVLNDPSQVHASEASLHAGPFELRDAIMSSVIAGKRPMRVRVQVQGKTFLIPCPDVSGEDRKTISWLSEQTQLRYFTAYGLRPVLKLQTSEGAYLSPEDTISDVLSNNEQVVASLESWDLPPLVERYKTACISKNSKVKKVILSSIQADPEISIVSLCNAALSHNDVLPLTRALQCHDSLIKLILPGNKIGDIGLQHIASCLDTLPNLTVLDLQCNGLTQKGLGYLVNSLKKRVDQQPMKPSSKLEELNLSYNHLTDTAAIFLADVIVTCPYLNSLQLESVSLTARAFETGRPLSEALKGSRLRHFDISRNPVSGNGIRDLLTVLPCSEINTLNVSSTRLDKNTVFIGREALCSYMNQEDCVLQTLIASDCCLSCCDVVRLTETRCFKSSLRYLDVSCNLLKPESNSTLSRSITDCNSQASSFNLRGNLGIGREFLEELLLNLVSSRSSPLTFNLSSCGISSPLPENIFHALKRSTIPLLEIDLSFCELNPEDVTMLCESWRHGDSRKASIANGPFLVLSTIQ